MTYTDYPQDTLANMLEQADAQIMHQRQVMDDMRGQISRLEIILDNLTEELESARNDNDDLRQECAAWRGR